MTPHPQQNSTEPKQHYILADEYVKAAPYRPATSQNRFWNGISHVFKLQGYVSVNNYTALAFNCKHSHAVGRQIMKSHIKLGYIKEKF